MTQLNERETPTAGRAALLDGYSLEMTAKDVAALHEASAAIVPGTQINVTYLGNEDDDARMSGARAVRELGFVPVPHLSARRIESAERLDSFLGALAGVGAAEGVFIIGGDPEQPAGPYADAGQLIESGLLERHGVRRVGIAGYPEGHPEIEARVLWPALEAKASMLAARGMSGSVITQFGFDVDPVLSWAEEVRARGIELPIRIGVPGPAGVRRLLAYAKRFGVGTGATIARKYGFSLTNLMSTAGPERFIDGLAEGYDPARHGELRLHFYTFGGLLASAEWIADFTAQSR